MQFFNAFPIAIIDEDFEGKNAAGRGMRDLAAEIEKQGFRVIGGIAYEDARRLVNVFNTESCWVVSVDGVENSDTRWQILEEVLAAKRRRNDRLPIFLFGDSTTAEMVPTSVLRHANAFMLGQPSASDARLFHGFPGVVQPFPGLQLRGAGRVPGAG
jgi:arginine decarboxylase